MNDPIFIIGAGRSGTNMLRDILTSLPNYTTWPCDEINLTFRHGNIKKENDLFSEADANEIATSYIKNVFQKLQDINPDATIIEKTCANSLRIPFLNVIFPNARYILIQRNGYDVTASSRIRWRATLEPKYLVKKLPYVPKVDIPYYTFQFANNRINQFLSKEKKQKVWGPIYKGMIHDSKSLLLEEVCAKQWASCIRKSNSDLDRLANNRVLKVNYEDVLINPKLNLSKILTWLNPNMVLDDSILDRLVLNIRNGKKMDPKLKFTSEELNRIESIIEPINAQFEL